jgi:hypothetical protein
MVREVTFTLTRHCELTTTNSSASAKNKTAKSENNCGCENCGCVKAQTQLTRRLSSNDRNVYNNKGMHSNVKQLSDNNGFWF